MPTKYRSKSATIEAILFTAEPAGLMRLSDFLDNGKDGWTAISYTDRNNPKLILDPNTDLHVNVGEYIVKLDDGQSYPMNAELFHKVFKAVE